MTYPATVTMSGVSKTFRRGLIQQDVLKAIDHVLPAGSMTAIMGSSGAGKSTLLNIVGGIERLDHGQLEVCGVRLDTATPRQLTAFRRDKVGFVFQFHNLMPSLTAIENVLLGLEAIRRPSQADRARALDFLDTVGLADKQDKYPSRLSGGEQQRVAIARALAKDPPLVLADEPTGNLDEANGDRIVALLKRLQRERGLTILLVTHNPLIAAICDASYILSAGQLASAVPPSDAAA